jgi:post-segregation antitoxin (ccd killing protein)
MPKRAVSKDSPRTFSFRMPGDVFHDLAAVARARGVDISGVLNWLISEARPRLVEELAEHEKQLAEAIASRAWEKAGSPAEALRSLRELLRKLQDEYAALSERVLDRDERRAA